MERQALVLDVTKHCVRYVDLGSCTHIGKRHVFNVAAELRGEAHESIESHEQVCGLEVCDIIDDFLQDEWVDYVEHLR